MNKSYSFEFSFGFFKLLILILLIVIILALFRKNNSFQNIESTSNLWTSYDINISQIKDNLDIVMDFSKDDTTCGSLKNITIKDDSYELALNDLGCYITLYYYNENNHNYLLKYKDNASISEKDFLSLKENLKDDTTFYTNLKKMLNFKYVDDTSTQELNKVISSYLDKFEVSNYDDCKNYTEVFAYKISELSYITYLSYWLKDEYLKLEF